MFPDFKKSKLVTALVGLGNNASAVIVTTV